MNEDRQLNNRVLLISRHELEWSFGPRASYVPAPPSNRFMLARHINGAMAGFRPEDFAAVHICGMRSDERLISVGGWLAQSHDCSHVVAVHEKAMLPAAAIREAAGVYGPGLAESRRLRDKWQMKDVLQASGSGLLPKWIQGSQSLAELGNPVGSKAVVKSRYGLGSTDMVVCRLDEDSVRSAVNSLGLTPADVIIEEYVVAPVYQCDSVVQDGRILFVSVSEYQQSPGRFRSNPLFSIMPLEPGTRRSALVAANAEVVRTLGVTSAVTHIEFFFDPSRGPIFIEAAGRPGGGGTNETSVLNYGVNLVANSVRLQCGQSPELPSQWHLPEKEFFGFVGFYHHGQVDRLTQLQNVLPWLTIKSVGVSHPPSHVADFSAEAVIAAESAAQYKERLSVLAAAIGLKKIELP